MRKTIAVITAALMMASVFTGCNRMTDEEKAAKAQQEAVAAATQEEQATGLKRLTSVNLNDAEKVLYAFVDGIKTDNAQEVADSVGAPNIFQDGALYGWILSNGYDKIKDADLGNIRVKSEKNGSEVNMSVFVNSDPEKEENAIAYTATYEGGKWILNPPAGVSSKYTFSAPTKDISCKDFSFDDYVVSAGENSYSWNFVVPHMLIMDTSPVYTIKSNLGEFEGQMYTVDGNNVLLATMTPEQKAEFEDHATEAFNTVFTMLKSGASTDDLSRKLLSEKIIKECTAFKDEAAAAAFLEKLNTVTTVTMSEDDVQSGWPVAYTYRLAGENAVTMNVKLCIGTSLGESRKKAAITMQDFDGDWKIVSVSVKSGENPFLEFNTYNPAW